MRVELMTGQLSQLDSLNWDQWSQVRIPLTPIYIYIYIILLHLLYHSATIYIYIILLHSSDYLKKVSIKTNVAIDEAISWNKTWNWTNDEIGAAVQSWAWVQIEVMIW